MAKRPILKLTQSSLRCRPPDAPRPSSITGILNYTQYAGGVYTTPQYLLNNSIFAKYMTAKDVPLQMVTTNNLETSYRT